MLGLLTRDTDWIWDCFKEKRQVSVWDGAHLQQIKSAPLWVTTMWSCPRVLGNCQISAVTSAILPSGAFLFSTLSQTSPLELISVTCHSQLSCDFPPESQKSSAYPSACLTPKHVCVWLCILTLWLQPGLLCYLATSSAVFPPRILFLWPYFPNLKSILIFPSAVQNISRE